MTTAAMLWVGAALLGVTLAAFDPTQDYTKCCVCTDLMPINPVPGSSPQVMPSPFKVKVNSESYSLDKEVIVELVSEGEHSFRDFILVAWPTDNRPKLAVGTIRLIQDDNNKEYVPKYSCYSSEANSYAIMTADLKPKRTLRFAWETKKFVGHVEFRATFIVDDDTYWVGEKSMLLLDSSPNAPPVPRSVQPRVTPPINVDDCGVTKGCYREPEGCWEPQCEYIVTWQGQTDRIRFELGGLMDTSKDRFVAVGLSNDTYMGSDTVFACAHDSSDESTRVHLSYNEGNRNIPLDRENLRFGERAIMNEEGSYHNGRLRCRFTVDRDLDRIYPELSYISGSPYHLLMSRGFANRGVLRRHGLGVNELPIASPSMVDLNDYSNIGDRARYPLVKAHGCLMILAWIFFASIGLIMTKYYKTMWPNQRMFDQRYWFVAHFNCMAMAFLITVIGVILIFVEADGWSQAPDLPQKAHPILGIIIFVCIIINPILALLRPNPDNKCRPVFNWFHWAFGTIANVLAIPTIFIGMDFGKANVPWWATWILVVWVIFHIVIELSLEVHQCCTYKKNKERRRKYEQQKRENPKNTFDEPEPAGRRFKRFMLFLHLTVTTIITLIMIIIIAVC
ncbi:putative ferric-chelate reductase 1 [Littorina saxatilis]|uniref:Ferric-chelate reductase 1 n=1 Tax=Littorina saxatilis TaxID=31220 RepID=A0AAN9G9H9_9CAEN